MLSQVNNSCTEKNSFAMENKKFKNMSFFNNKSLTKEIQNLKISLGDRQSFLDSYSNCEDLTRKAKNLKLAEKSDKKLLNSGRNFFKKGSVFKTLIFEEDVQSKGEGKDRLQFLSTKFNSKIHSPINNIDQSHPKSLFPSIENRSQKKLITIPQSLLTNEKDRSKEKEALHLYKKIFEDRGKTIIKTKPANVVKKEQEEEKKSELRFKILKKEKKTNEVENKITQIKKKLGFIKGVYDYAYPLVMIEKIKAQKKYYEIYIEKFNEKIKSKNEQVRKMLDEGPNIKISTKRSSFKTTEC